jgi:radical SAM superfamily enzyme YgiQ (UPF0313 family)
MKVHLVNPSDVSFGTAVITPRWPFVIAAATPASYGDPVLVDETVSPLDPGSIQPGDVVGIGIHSGNALRGYAIGRLARQLGAYVVYGGIHATLYPQESRTLGWGQAVVQGDGDLIWATVLEDCRRGALEAAYSGGRVDACDFVPARWDLVPRNSYMWASVQTVRGCPKHCSFCSVWRIDGQLPRQPAADAVIEEIVQLRRLGFRYIALADDNFYPVTLTDLQLASRPGDAHRLAVLKAMRAERFELMARLALPPPDMIFFTQITMEAAEDPAFLEAMRKANIKGALVGVESVTPEGLKDVYKEFNSSGGGLVDRLQAFRKHDTRVLGSFIFGLPSDRPETFDATAEVAQSAGLTFAQFVALTPFPGTVDFARWEKTMAKNPRLIEGIPVTRYWLIPQAHRPKVHSPHPSMSAEEIRRRTQSVWKRFYSVGYIWKRARFLKSLRSRLTFLLISKVYRQMYADTGMATDSARAARSARRARWPAKPCRYLFAARPMPQLKLPDRIRLDVRADLPRAAEGYCGK